MTLLIAVLVRVSCDDLPMWGMVGEVLHDTTKNSMVSYFYA